MDVTHSMECGEPLPVLLYGTNARWKAGVILVYKEPLVLLKYHLVTEPCH
jgi:hypothetical protein